jgi:hypothetical protein
LADDEVFLPTKGVFAQEILGKTKGDKSMKRSPAELATIVTIGTVRKAKEIEEKRERWMSTEAMKLGKGGKLIHHWRFLAPSLRLFLQKDEAISSWRSTST